MLRLCYAHKSFNDSLQRPQRIVEPQYVEGSRLLRRTVQTVQNVQAVQVVKRMLSDRKSLSII